MTQEQLDLQLLDPVLDHYKAIPGSLITILQKTQELYGYLPVPAMEKISTQTGIATAKVMGVATFYTQFRLSPIGKHLIMLCQGTACHVNGSELIENAISDELSITDGQTTADGVFTLKNVACLGCCSLAPAMMIGEQVYGSLTPDKTRTILQKIREEEAQSE